MITEEKTDQEILDILDGIRKRICAEKEDLPVDVPLAVLSGSGTSKDHFGRCHCDYEGWYLAGEGIKVSRKTKATKIEIRLRDLKGMLFPMEILIPVLIHELAHVIAPGES